MGYLWIFIISTGAGFLPATVSSVYSCMNRQILYIGSVMGNTVTGGRPEDWSSRDVLFLKRAWWMFAHSSASGNMNEIFKTHFSPVTLELSCLTLKTAACTDQRVVMCRFAPLTMWTWRMSCACGSASTPEPRTWTMRHSLAFEISPTNFVETWWIL